MGKGQAEEHHRPFGDRSPIDHRLVHYSAHSQDADLWGVMTGVNTSIP
jgi:hypothetical protein